MTGSDTFTQNAIRPLRHYADFSGRSTRSELFAFYILNMLAGLVAYAAFAWIFIVIDLPDWMQPWDIVWLAALCPWIALCVRRLHDLGRSGWWLLLILPVAAMNAFEFYHQTQDRFVKVPGLVELAAGLPFLALIVLLLWNEQEGINGYGPNPRYDDSGPTGDRPEAAR